MISTSEYETYLESKLPEHEFIWIREPYHDQVTLQWNKMWGMQLDIDEPICVMDIDVLLVNDYKKVFDYPIQRGEFVAMPGGEMILQSIKSMVVSLNISQKIVDTSMISLCQIYISGKDII